MSTCKSHKSYEFLKATCEVFLFNENFIHIFNASWSYPPFELPLTVHLPTSGMSTSQPHVFFISEKNDSWVQSVMPVDAVVWCHSLGYTQPASGFVSKEDWPHPLQVTITTVNSQVQWPIKSWRWRCTALAPPMSAVSQNVQKMALHSAPPHPALTSFLPLSGCSLSLCVDGWDSRALILSTLTSYESLPSPHSAPTKTKSSSCTKQIPNTAVQG